MHYASLAERLKATACRAATPHGSSNLSACTKGEKMYPSIEIGNLHVGNIVFGTENNPDDEDVFTLAIDKNYLNKLFSGNTKGIRLTKIQITESEALMLIQFRKNK
jgi:hypothetical protein